MNKKTFLLLLLLTVFTLSQAQERPAAIVRLQTELQELNKAYQAAYNQKEHVAAAESLLAQLRLFNSLRLSEAEEADNRKLINAYKSNIYYNLACSYALRSMRKPAVEAFRKAVELGYRDYRHALADTDFDNIRGNKEFRKLVESLRQYDHLHILQQARGYRAENTDTLPRFTYQSAGDYKLQSVRWFFNLDSIAGTGSEVSKIINILAFAHNSIRHDGGNYAMCENDALDIYNYHRTTGNGVNCRQMAMALNDMYLSMGFPSRVVTCMPRDVDDPDCHVINCVYSSEQGKWLWMDATFNAYVKDEHGTLLGIAEVRDRLIHDQPLVLNEDANWNNQSKQTKEQYLDSYMAKNLYWLSCITNNEFCAEGHYRYNGQRYLLLVPEGFSSSATANAAYTLTSDAAYFWQAPGKAPAK